MFSSDKLENILCGKIVSVKETSYGVTNKNYIVTTNSDKKYFYRVPKQNSKLISKNNEKEALSLLENEYYFLKPVFYSNNHLITEFKDVKTFISTKDLTSIVKIANILRDFHEKKFNATETFNIIDKFKDYYSQVDNFRFDIEKFLPLVDEVEKIYTPDRLCHNDLTEGNFLFTGSKVYLIDYEYAGFNDFYFDIASFISGCDLDYQETVTFLKNYFVRNDCDFNKLNIFLQFCDLFWYVWASMMYEKNGNEIYESLLINRYNNLKNPKNITY